MKGGRYNTDWNDRILRKAPKVEAEESWWVKLDRDQFAAKVKGEAERMRSSRFGKLAKMIDWREF